MRHSEDRLEDCLLQPLAASRAPVLRTDPLVCGDVSLLRSAWQKAIRRGHAELAMRAVMALHQRDPAYVWRRLRVIALEDVGLGHLPLVAQALAVAGNPDWRLQHGEIGVLGQLTARLAHAPKSRAACDLLDLAHGAANADREPGAAPAGARTRRALPLTAVIVHALASEAELAYGGRTDRSRAPLSPLLDYIVRRGSGTCTLNRMLPLAWQLAQGRGTVRAAPPTTPSSTDPIGAVPAYAWCQYTAPGRAALRVFLATSAPLAWQLRGLRLPDAPAVLGHLVFHSEGAYCARMYAFPGTAALQAAAERATLRACGVPAAALAPLAAAVPAALPALNAARRAVAARRGWLP